MALPKGFKHSAETRAKISLGLKGRVHSEETKKKIALGNLGKLPSEDSKRKMSIAKKGLYVGDKHPNWQGGITPDNVRIRNSLEYKAFRASIFERDNYTCQHCYAKGVYLNLDHIKPFSRYAELRFEPTNCRTLCVPCHEKTPTYKGKMRNYVCD